MTKFEFLGETFVVDGDKIKSKLQDMNEFLKNYALLNEGFANLSVEFLIVSAAIYMGAVVTGGDYLSYLQDPPGTVY